jgi:hypothetical protein
VLGESKRRRSCPSGQLHGGGSFGLVNADGDAIVCEDGNYMKDIHRSLQARPGRNIEVPVNSTVNEQLLKGT